jgi:serine protease Do
MTRRVRRALGLGVLAVLAVAVALGIMEAREARTVGAPASAADRISESRRSAIVTAAERVSPAVISVSVVTTRVVRSDPVGGMLHDEFWDRFYPPTEYRERVPSLGSGVIIDDQGVALTNAHVIRNADEITVTLTDGRQFPAKLLGASDTYDLAVLKVAGTKLPVAALGNSDQLVVGEWAIAIGNPFGYLLSDTQPSVTAGVISATRRDIKSDATETGVYKNMIQTDAAINPGNSGGPLINGDGQVIGINTFIFTQGGGSLGMGFAIPINLARRILDEIKTYGRVRTAWPGMQVQPVTEYIARRLGLKDASGLIVSRVDANGPAAKAGVRVGDLVREVNGRTIRTVDDAQRGIYGASVGDRLNLVVDRNGEKLTFSVTLLEAPRTP